MLTYSGYRVFLQLSLLILWSCNKLRNLTGVTDLIDFDKLRNLKGTNSPVMSESVNNRAFCFLMILYSNYRYVNKLQYF